MTEIKETYLGEEAARPFHVLRESWQEEALRLLRARHPELDRHPLERKTVRWLRRQALHLAALRHLPNFSAPNQDNKSAVNESNLPNPPKQEPPQQKPRLSPLKGVEL